LLRGIYVVANKVLSLSQMLSNSLKNKDFS